MNYVYPYIELFSLQVFGLGNKTYEHFNAMGKYVDRRLEELGAIRIHELGAGDDDAKYASYDSVYKQTLSDVLMFKMDSV